MSKTVVIYGSIHGTTKQYAEWIGEELGAKVYERKGLKPKDLERFSTIIYGGGLYAGGVTGADLIHKNFDEFKGKNIVLFTCGLADISNEENIKGIHRGLDRVFTGVMKEKIKFFHLRGGINYKKLSFIHRGMMKMVVKVASKKDKDTMTAEEREMIETYGKVVDFMDRKTIKPLVEYVKGL